MRKKNYKGRRTKSKMSKCIGICVTYDDLQQRLAEILSTDDNILEFSCNVSMEGLEYTSDVVATDINNNCVVFECCTRNTIIRPSVGKLLDSSREYWLSRGISEENWRLVIDETK